VGRPYVTSATAGAATQDNDGVTDEIATQVTIREARPEEAEAVGTVIRAAYAQFVTDYPAESWQRFYEMVGRVDGHFEKAEVIVAEYAGRVVATVSFYGDGSQSAQGEWPAGWAGMLRLAVLPQILHCQPKPPHCSAIQ